MNASEILTLVGFNSVHSLRIPLDAMPVSRLIEIHNNCGFVPIPALDYYLLSNCLRKHPKLVDGIDIEGNTLLDFYEAEKRASHYNSLFEALTCDERMLKILNIWRDQVRLIMGKHEYAKPVITSGATTTCATGNIPLLRFKESECTASLKKVLPAFQSCWDVPWDELSENTALGTVAPKTYKVGRMVFSPACANALVQRSDGLTLRERLRIEGIDLRNAQDIHKRLASFASIRNHLTTDDQKWASPLIYKSLVRFLVSDEWYYHLDAARDDVVRLPDGSEVKLAQFATQGNGFCFELETIIFLGLLRTAAYIKGLPIRHKDIRVFGDDLIYPSELTQVVRKVGAAVGFITNVDKSYSEGYFRESCGGDYINGLNVRPVYLKGDPNSCHDLTIMANQLYDLQLRYDFMLPQINKLWKGLIKRIYRIGGRSKALWGPRTSDCLHGRLPGNWRTVTQGKGQRPMIKTWEVGFQPKDMMSFREVAYKTNPDYLMRMVTAGLVKGHGALVRPYREETRGRFTCVYLAESYYPRTISVPGSQSVAKVVDRQLYLFPNRVDEMNPMSVFNVLPLTRCPQRLYSRDYIKTCERIKMELLKQFVEQLKDYRKGRSEKLSQVVETLTLDLDF